MPIDQSQLRALAAIVREGSFERAALALHVTPSAVSQRIRALEDRIGRLLVQRTNPARATPEGQVLVQLAEQTALMEQDAWRRMGLADAQGTRSLSVAVNHDSLETWFVDVAVRFAQDDAHITLDVQSDDQDHTAALLRSGTVLGAVTASAETVQGCNRHPLGSMRYAATCSPAFHAKYFARGVNAQTMAHAPVLVFNAKDALQARFAARVMKHAPWRPPTWGLPSSRVFIDATLRGVGWTMNPLPMVRDDLQAGRLVLLRARAWEDVPLYWQHWRMEADIMGRLTRCVIEAARKDLIKPRPVVTPPQAAGDQAAREASGTGV